MSLLLLLTLACTPCHLAQVEAAPRSAMTHALQPAKASPLKRSATIGGYTYLLDKDSYTVTDGKQSLQFPLEWAFGKGTTGQTYLYQQAGRWYESRVSYYPAIDGLDLTIGAQSIQPHNLAEASGRLLSTSEARKCFACHATSATVPGIQCERCHTSTSTHFAKLTKLSTEETSNFCGQCHRTWSQVSIDGPRGIQNLRFQPYRLTGSKCYDATDKRIACTTCHNPHDALQTSARNYDSKCQQCHGATAKVCKTAKQDCTTCHMPKLDLPGAHAKFTDHRIRVVKPNERYPD